MKKLILILLAVFTANIPLVRADMLIRPLINQETPKKQDDKDKKEDKGKKKHGEGHEINKRHNKKPK
jgi:hypothetical protein